MDTPGGLMGSMRDIITNPFARLRDTRRRLHPRRAARRPPSAGGYIMLSAHVAAMAPGTEIGAMNR
jgi:membrane-bound serine protease (ClpP class)